MIVSSINEGSGDGINWRTRASYHILQWIIIGVSAGVLIPVWDRIPFHKYTFNLNDSTLSNPLWTDTIPYSTLLIVVIIVPIAIYFLLGVFEKCQFQPEYAVEAPSTQWNGYRGIWLAYLWSVGHIESLIGTVIFTELAKRLFQRLRPDFIYRCFHGNIPLSTLTSSAPLYLVTTDACTVDTSTSEFTDGRLSFLSGHTSTAFSCMTYLSIFLYTYFISNKSVKKQAMSASTALGPYLYGTLPWKTLAVFAPLLFALAVGGSRHYDNRHHMLDILMGALLGIIVSSAVYYINRENYIVDLLSPTSATDMGVPVAVPSASSSLTDAYGGGGGGGGVSEVILEPDQRVRTSTTVGAVDKEPKQQKEAAPLQQPVADDEEEVHY